MMIPEVTSEDVAKFQPPVEGVLYNEEGTPVLEGLKLERPSIEVYLESKENIIKAIHHVEDIYSPSSAKEFLQNISEDLRNVILGTGEIDESKTHTFGIDVINPTCKIGGKEGDKLEATLLPSSGVITVKLSNSGLDANLRPIDGVELTLPIDKEDKRYEEFTSTILRLDGNGQVSMSRNINELQGEELNFFKNCLQSSLTAISMGSDTEIKR